MTGLNDLNQPKISLFMIIYCDNVTSDLIDLNVVLPKLISMDVLYSSIDIDQITMV